MLIEWAHMAALLERSAGRDPDPKWADRRGHPELCSDKDGVLDRKKVHDCLDQFKPDSDRSKSDPAWILERARSGFGHERMIERYVRQAPTVELRSRSVYNLVCYYASTKDYDEAFRQLRISLESGALAD